MGEDRLHSRAQQEDPTADTVFGAIDAGLVVVNAEGRVVTANDAFLQIFGFDRELIDQRPLMTDLLHRWGADRQVEAALLERAESQLRRRDFFVCRIPDGPRLLEQRHCPLPNGGFVRLYLDVTERNHMEEALRDSEARFRALFDASPVGIALIRHGRFLFANPAAAALAGLASPRDVIGLDLFDFIAPECRDDLKTRYRQRLEGQSVPSAYDAVALRRDGSRFDFNIVLAPFPANEGGDYLAFVSDISSRKALEEDLRRARTAAEEAARAKSVFLANMSHEIRTPMNAVLGLAELLLGTPLESSQRDFAHTIKTSAEGLLVLLNDILDFSRIEAGRLEIVPEPLNLRTSIGDVIATIGPMAEAKGLELSTDIDTTLPESVMGDPGRIRQILLNLVGNAVKFTDDGRVTVRLKLLSRIEDLLTLRIEVEDTGIGIPADRMGDLFQTFSQIESDATRRHGGAGLGLAISRKLAEMMGGELRAASEGPGKGATFTFLFETRTTCRPPTESEVPHAPDETLGATHPLRILLAEDNETNRKVALAILARLGYEATVARNGHEAVEAVCRDPFDLILMDIQMPEMDGIEAARRIRSLCAAETTPHIAAFTANAHPEEREAMLNAGFDDHLAKPVRITDIARLLRRVYAARVEASQCADALLENLHRSLGVEEGAPIVQNLVSTYLEEAPRLAGEILLALRAENVPVMLRAAHTLKSSSILVGAQAVAALSQGVEEAAREGELATVRLLAPRLEGAVQSVLRRLRRAAQGS